MFKISDKFCYFFNQAGTAQETAKIMVKHLIRDNCSSRLQLSKGDKVVVMVNNLGALTNIEMTVMIKEFSKQLGEYLSYIAEYFLI